MRHLKFLVVLVLVDLSTARGVEYTRSDRAAGGVVVAHRPARNQIYIVSPSLARLDNGTLVAGHDEFGPNIVKGTVYIYRSTDNGDTWTQASIVKNQFWSNLFVHRNRLYLFGTRPGQVSLRCSSDGGFTWSEAKDENSGLLTAKGKSYHTSSVPTVEANGRLWRALERSDEKGLEGMHPLMMSAPDDADLMRAESWTMSHELDAERSWLPRNEF